MSARTPSRRLLQLGESRTAIPKPPSKSNNLIKQATSNASVNPNPPTSPPSSPSSPSNTNEQSSAGGAAKRTASPPAASPTQS